ncbi:hypothetical protein ACFLQL_03045 [Verrucomicrobiota bacterium]
MKQSIEFSTNGGKTWKQCDELRVNINDCGAALGKEDLNLYFNFTDEGLIIDNFTDDDLDRTFNNTYEEIYKYVMI